MTIRRQRLSNNKDDNLCRHDRPKIYVHDFTFNIHSCLIILFFGTILTIIRTIVNCDATGLSAQYNMFAGGRRMRIYNHM